MRNIYFFSLLFILIFTSFTNSYEIGVYATLFVLILKLLQKFGRSITLRELIAVYSCIIYLLMPLFGYKFYSSRNNLSKLWVKFMAIPQSEYFNFAFPALLVFFLALFFPNLNKNEEPDSNSVILHFITSIKKYLAEDRTIWKLILFLGLVGYVGKIYFPSGGLTFIFFTLYLFLFTAFLYMYYSPPFKYRVALLSVIILLIVIEAVQSGMFTVLVYMGITLSSILFVGMRISLWKKLSMVTVVLFLLLSLQLSKKSYRNITWKSNYEGSKVELLWSLMTDKFLDYQSLFDDKNFFPVYVRMNQGYNVALVMRRIPAIQDFDHGNSIMLTIGSALVPRFLWPDKMRSGGVYNMYHFAGYRLRGWSTNIGPVGEAYGNFGVFGGICFMFFFGLFIRWIYFKVISLARNMPLLLFWIPVLFFELSYSMENDTLQALNSIIKISIFLYILFLIYPRLFGKQLPAFNSKRLTLIN